MGEHSHRRVASPNSVPNAVKEPATKRAKVKEPATAAKKPAKEPADKKPANEPAQESTKRAVQPKAKLCYRQENPKRAGSASYTRYEAYKVATTVAEFQQLGGSMADLKH